MPARPVIDRLEMHVTHACNLTCESCSHYSNHNHKERVEPEEADLWFGAWSRRISVDDFVLLGGEPTLHPRLADFVPRVRKHWPQARITLITNGFFLDRRPELPLDLAEAGNCVVKLSVHHNSADYDRRIRPVLSLLERWPTDFGISVDVWTSYSNWTRRYTGFGDEMAPFEDGDPRASWSICPARHCKQLHAGKIWKCAPLAYLKMQKRRFRLSAKWDPYLQYEPLAPDCDAAALEEFLRREDESVCSMCPSHRREFPCPIRCAASSADANASRGRSNLPATKTIDDLNPLAAGCGSLAPAGCPSARQNGANKGADDLHLREGVVNCPSQIFLQGEEIQ
jgi:hypothetical protein